MANYHSSNCTFEAYMENFPYCCGLTVLGSFSFTVNSPLTPDDWNGIRQAILRDIEAYNLMTCAVTVLQPHDNWNYEVSEGHQRHMADLYRFIESLGMVIRTFRNPGHDSTLNLVLLNPQQLGVSTYDFG